MPPQLYGRLGRLIRSTKAPIGRCYPTAQGGIAASSVCCDNRFPLTFRKVPFDQKQAHPASNHLASVLIDKAL